MKVREVIKILEKDDWYLREQKVVIVSLSTNDKAGVVTVSGKESVDVPRGTLNSIWKQAGLKDRKDQE